MVKPSSRLARRCSGKSRLQSRKTAGSEYEKETNINSSPYLDLEVHNFSFILLYFCSVAIINDLCYLSFLVSWIYILQYSRYCILTHCLQEYVYCSFVCEMFLHMDGSPVKHFLYWCYQYQCYFHYKHYNYHSVTDITNMNRRCQKTFLKIKKRVKQVRPLALTTFSFMTLYL